MWTLHLLYTRVDIFWFTKQFNIIFLASIHQQNTCVKSLNIVINSCANEWLLWSPPPQHRTCPPTPHHFIKLPRRSLPCVCCEINGIEFGLGLDVCQGSASVITMWQQDFVGEMKIPTSEGFVDKESGSLYFRFDGKLTTGI